MTRSKRRILFYSVVFIFLFTAPLLTAYTSGYRIDWKNRSFIRLGSIIIETIPDTAKIFLNGKLSSGVTPYRLSNLTPNSYTVKLEKEGYYSWEKNISVKEGKTNLLVNIPLFKKTAPTRIISGNIQNINVSPSFLFRSILALLEETDDSYEITTSDFSGEKRKTLFRQSKKDEPPKLHGFSFNHQFLLISSGVNWFLIQTETDELIELPLGKNPLTIQQVHWDAEKRNIIIIDTKRVVRFDPNTRKKEILLEKENVSDFQIFPNGTSILFSDSNQNEITAMDAKTEETLFRGEIQTSAWKNNHTFLYASSNEIFLFDMLKKKKTLITREGGNIQKVFPLRDVNYTLLLQNNSLILLELTGEEPPLRIPLEIEGIQIREFEVSENGKEIFIATPNGLFLQIIQ